jgi:hypothetical protein
MPETMKVYALGFDEPITINVEDFDESVHRRESDGPAEEKRKPGRPSKTE